MYLRIDTHRLIFRISRQEADALLDGQTIEDMIAFGPEFKWSYRVTCDQSKHQCSWNDKDNSLNLIVGRKALESELEGRPSKEGMSIPVVSTGSETTAWLQIDLKKKS